MINKELLLEVAKSKGLKNREHIEKDYFQDLVLFHIYKLSNNFIFKGGTCLYKLYNMPRFSEDLDFSILEDKNVEKTIENVAKKLEAKIEKRKTKSAYLFKLRFKGILTQANTLRIDVSRINIVFSFETKAYIPSYPEINIFHLRHLSLKEILSEKIHALVKRNNARDLFDIFFLLRFTPFDEDLTRKKFEIFKMKFDKNILKEKINSIESKWEKELSPFLLTELPDFKIVKEFVARKLLL
jgi:predicted nucleotidyltransferase component of viral defense system